MTERMRGLIMMMRVFGQRYVQYSTLDELDARLEMS